MSLTREECLNLDIDFYNKAKEKQWETMKSENESIVDLSVCIHCSRKYMESCICDDGRLEYENKIANAIIEKKKNDELFEKLISDKSKKEEKVEKVDELFEKAATIIVEKQQASVALLQIRLKIDYKKAAILMAQLQKHNVIGPFCGEKCREVRIQYISELERKFKEINENF